MYSAVGRAGLLACGVALAPAWLMASPAVQAGTLTTLHAFTGGSDGAVPWSQLTPGSSGSLLGTNSEGGAICDADPNYGCGVIYRLDSKGKLTTIHTFTGGTDGANSHSGVTSARGPTGIRRSACFSRRPTADSLAPPGWAAQATSRKATLAWASLFFVRPSSQYSVVHIFTGGADGKNPNQLLKDNAGNVFGSALGGGTCSASGGCGVIFEYNAASRQFSVIYDFQNASDGRAPMLGGIDAAGTLYGAAAGGDHKHGTLFSLTPAGGVYKFKVLASLRSTVENDNPINPPALSRDGALVGATGTSMYGYQNGQVATLATFSASTPIVTPLGQFLIGRHTDIYGTSNGSVTPCVFSTGVPDAGGCGDIFLYTLRTP